MEVTRQMLQHFADLAPGDTAIYHVTAGGLLETLYLSEDVPALLDLTREEYLAITQRDAMELTLPADRRGLQEATANCIRTGKPFDYYYRVFHKTKGFEWVHVHAHVCGRMDGRPLILALFANMTAEGGIYQQILDASDRKTFVIDRESYDILYANETGTADASGKTRSLLDQKCYAFLHGLTAPCANCPLKPPGGERFSEEILYDSQTGKWERLTKRLITWCGHPALLLYSKDVTEEKQSELAAERYRQMYADATQEAKLVVWTYDTDTHRVSMLWDGYTKEICERLHLPQLIENVPDSLAPYVDPRDREDFVRMYRDMDGGAAHGSCEFRFQLPGQALPRYVRAVASAIFGEEGRRPGVYCFCQNITAQKEEELKYLRAFEELGKSHLYSLGTYYMNLTKDLCRQEENPTAIASRLWQSGKVDDFFAAISVLIDGAEKKAEFFRLFSREALLRAFSQGQDKVSIEYPSVGEDGARHWREGLLFMVRNPRTGDVEGVAYAMDIDARKRSELVLQKLIHENFDYIGIIHPAQATFEFVSRRSWITFGAVGERLDYRECGGAARAMFCDEEERRRFDALISIDHVLRSLRRGGGQASETYFRTADGRTACLRLTYRWLEQPEGDILVMRSDITDSYEQEQRNLAQMRRALAEADRANEAKSVFLSTMSHDLRTPLNGVLRFTDFALAESDPDRKREYLEKVRHSGSLLLSLINDTLELSRIESGKLTLTPETEAGRNVGPAVIESLRPVAEAKGVRLVSGAFPDPYIYVDKLKLQKIWLNLLSNAIKYTPPGGTVRAFVEMIDPPHGSRNRRLVVEDDGIGMSEEFMARMFEPFAQENRPEAGNAGGTGIGLTIVKRIVDLLGGTIAVRSNPGEGTRFEVELPVPTADGPAAAGQQPAPAEDALRGKRVLLCEDNLLNREIAEILLKNRGVLVESAENGEAGVRRFAASAPGYFDAVLMDLRMPVMDGCEAARAIGALDRPDAKTVPIIAMTADAFEQSTQEALSAGMKGYLTKPVIPEKLYDVLHGLLAAESGAGK